MSGLAVLKSQVTSELARMKCLLGEAAELENKRASNINIRAGGSVLHDFYTGAENIFGAIAKAIDEQAPSGMSWHVELLNQMTLDLEGIRTAVIRPETARIFEELLRFRHLFRKRYGFDLDWLGIRNLLKKMPAAFEALEHDIRESLKNQEP